MVEIVFQVMGKYTDIEYTWAVRIRNYTVQVQTAFRVQYPLSGSEAKVALRKMESSIL